MPDKKSVFVAFASEDENQADYLKGESLDTSSSYEYVDSPVKDARDSEWKDRVRKLIRDADGVIALVSMNSINSAKEQWEISCAKEERKKLIGLQAYADDHTNPDFISGTNIMLWTWDRIANYIDSL